MMDVWVATARVEYEDYEVIGVYLAKEEAEAACIRFMAAVRAHRHFDATEEIRGYWTKVEPETIGVDGSWDLG